MNRQDMETTLARLLGDLLIEGVVDSGGANSIADAELVFAESGLLRGMDLYIKAAVSGSNYDTSRTIATYAQGSLAVIPSFSATPTTGDTYNIYKQLRHADYKASIEHAYRTASDLFLLDSQATLVLVATQWQYAVPSGFKYLNSIYLVPSLGTDFDNRTGDNYYQYRELDRRSWLVKVNPNGSYVIDFDPRFINLNDFNQHSAVVVGQKGLPSLSTPSQNIEPAVEGYVFAAARAMLAPRLLRDASLLNTLIPIQNSADRLEKHIFRARHSNSVEVR